MSGKLKSPFIIIFRKGEDKYKIIARLLLIIKLKSLGEQIGGWTRMVHKNNGEIRFKEPEYK